VKRPEFQAAYRAARREALDEAMAVLELEAATAAKALANEFSPSATGDPLVVRSSTAFLKLAFKAREAATIEDEINALRARVAEIDAQYLRDKRAAAGGPLRFEAGGSLGCQAMPAAPAAPTENVEMMMTTMNENSQRESIMLRTLWMNLQGHDASDILASVRFDRPTSLTDEQEKLDLVQRLVEHEWARADDGNSA
jgi:hypothetical protein